MPSPISSESFSYYKGRVRINAGEIQCVFHWTFAENSDWLVGW